MKKLFVDDIHKKGDKSSPGPGKYEENRNFSDGTIAFGMRQKLDTDKKALERSAKLPGPGNYEHHNPTGLK